MSFAAARDREMCYLHKVRVCGREMRGGWKDLPQELFQVQSLQDAPQVSNSRQESITGTTFKELGDIKVTNLISITMTHSAQCVCNTIIVQANCRIIFLVVLAEVLGA